MKTFLGVFCTLLLLTGGPILAASSPPKIETADTVKADMKDQMAKLKLQHKDQTAKLRAAIYQLRAADEILARVDAHFEREWNDAQRGIPAPPPESVPRMREALAGQD